MVPFRVGWRIRLGRRGFERGQRVTQKAGQRRLRAAIGHTLLHGLDQLVPRHREPETSRGAIHFALQRRAETRLLGLRPACRTDQVFRHFRAVHVQGHLDVQIVLQADAQRQSAQRIQHGYGHVGNLRQCPREPEIVIRQSLAAIERARLESGRGLAQASDGFFQRRACSHQQGVGVDAVNSGLALSHGAGHRIIHHTGHERQNVGILALPHIQDGEANLRHSSDGRPHHADHGARGRILGRRLRDQSVHQRRIEHRLHAKAADQRGSGVREPPVLAC